MSTLLTSLTSSNLASIIDIANALGDTFTTMISEASLYQWVGNKLRDRRKELGLTQADLALRVGMKRTSITNIETGYQQCPLHVLYRLCEALRIEAREVVPLAADVDIESTSNIESIVQQTAKSAPKSAELLKLIYQEHYAKEPMMAAHVSKKGESHEISSSEGSG